jgi:hypothetical protein|nr:MAG TPA: tyrosine recombinase [Caudoviricetes sp.]
MKMEKFKQYIEETTNEGQLNKYQKNKLQWLYDSKYSYNSKLNFWKLFKRNVDFVELEKNKDVYDFDRQEIIDLIKNTPTTKVSTKLTIFSMISRYIDWAVQRGFNYMGNPCDTINVHKILDIDTEVTKEQYKSLHDFYDWLGQLKRATPVDKMILLMLRYGIDVKNIGEIKMQDMDIEKNILHCKNGDIEVSLPIDEEFIQMAIKSNECIESDDVSYIVSDYIAKVQTNMQVPTLDKTVIYNRINVIFKRAEEKRISIPLLNLSRRYDILYNKYLLNGEVTIDDVKETLKIFNGKFTPNQALTLKRNFELAMGGEIKVNTFRTRK